MSKPVYFADLVPKPVYLAILVDGVTVWSVGTWPSEEEAVAWMDRHDDLFGDLVTDFTQEAREDVLNAGENNYWPDVDVKVQHLNLAEDLGWGNE
jgi:hypothetical protein